MLSQAGGPHLSQLFSPMSSGWQWHAISWFAGLHAPHAVFRRLPAGRHAHTEKCADASVSIFTRNVGHYFHEPLVLCRVFSGRHIAPGGALDDEEFFVVEASWVAGSPGV